MRITIYNQKREPNFGVSLRFCFILFLGNYVTEEQLMEIAEYSEVLNIPNDFLESDFRESYINIIPYPERIKNGEWYNVYIYLKEKFV